MKMKNRKTLITLVSILLISISGIGYAQKNKKVIPPPPPPPPIDIVREPKITNSVEKIIKQSESTVCFRWNVNKFEDKALLPEEQFTEILEFVGDVNSRNNFAVDSVTIKKEQSSLLTSTFKLKSYTVKYVNETIILKDEENPKLIRTFKVFLDKPKKNILKIQEIANGRFYFPAAFQGPTIMMSPD